jgi:hypothetical protein
MLPTTPGPGRICANALVAAQTRQAAMMILVFMLPLIADRRGAFRRAA